MIRLPCRVGFLIVYTTKNMARLTCSLFLSKLICSPVIGIVIHLSTLKIWVS